MEARDQQDCASENTWKWGDSDSSLCEGILMANINKSNKICLALLMLLAATNLQYSDIQ